MKERPILFSAPMVRAILEGRKTQTRRIMKPQPDAWIRGSSGTFGVPQKITNKKPTSNGSIWQEDDGTCYVDIVCPYGQPEDRLWVRETWRKNDWPTGNPYEYRATAKQDGTPEDGPWRPSLLMPRDTCRLLLEIKSILGERLQDISEADAIAEGVESFRPVPGDGEPVTRYRDYMSEKKFLNGKSVQKFPFTSPIDSFFSLWEYINGPESVDQNPFVWAVEFNPIK